MKRRSLSFVCLLALVLVLAYGSGSLLAAQDLKADQIAAKHLDSIATAAKRAEVKTLLIVGNASVASVRSPSNDVWAIPGKVAILSEAHKMFFGSKFNSAKYPMDEIVCDAKDVSVAFITPGKRSIFGDFMMSHRYIVNDGVFGGTLSTAWALNDLASRKGKIKGGSKKKIDGKDVYALEYIAKGGSSLNIKMYFDAETFQHVRTEYRKETPAAMVGRENQSDSASQVATVYQLTENFSNYKDFKGLMLPRSYQVNFQINGKQTFEWEWKYDLNEFALNEKFDPTTFALSN